MSDKTPFEETWERQQHMKEETSALLSNLDADAWLAICQIISSAFVESHVKARRHYEPTRPRESLDDEFLQDLRDALQSLEHDLPNTVSRISDEQRPSIHIVLELLDHNIQWLMRRPSGTWPFLHS